MNLKAFIEVFRERGKNGALFPLVLLAVLAVGLFPTLVLSGLAIVTGLFAFYVTATVCGSRLRAWWRGRNAPPPERPLVIYLKKKRY